MAQQKGDSLPAADPEDASTWMPAPSHLLVPSDAPCLPSPCRDAAPGAAGRSTLLGEL